MEEEGLPVPKTPSPKPMKTSSASATEKKAAHVRHARVRQVATPPDSIIYDIAVPLANVAVGLLTPRCSHFTQTTC